MSPRPVDPDMPDPFNLKKKTVRLPDIRDFQGKDPAIYSLALGHAELQDNQNVIISSMEWNNRITWERLNEGAGLLKELKFIRRILIWGGGIVGAVVIGAMSIIGADSFEHWVHLTK